MTDSRTAKQAKVLVHYSIELKRGETLELFASHLAKELTLAVYEEAVKVGAHGQKGTSLVHNHISQLLAHWRLQS